MTTTFWSSCVKAQSRRRWLHCARAAHDPIQVFTRYLTGVAEAHTAYGGDLVLGGDSVSLVADGPVVNIWTWPRR
jgi:hypothetical protein